MKTLIFLLGAPGIGKTTFLEKKSLELFGDDRLMKSVISPDNIRMMIETPREKPDGNLGITQTNERYVWKIINDIIAKKVNIGELIIVDATHSRNSAISAYKKYHDIGYSIYGIDFSKGTSLEETLKRNASRSGYKQVPEKVVRTIYARTEDINIPTWVTTLLPEEFNQAIKVLPHDFSAWNSMTVFGDIHGCSDELKSLFDANGIDDQDHGTKDGFIFVGDYFDRGPKIIETFKLLQEIREKHFCFFIEGNHEEPLRYYKQFMQSMTAYIHEKAYPSIKNEHFLHAVVNRSVLNLTTEVESLEDTSTISGKTKALWRRVVGLSEDNKELKNKLSQAIALDKANLKYEQDGLDLLKGFESKSYKQLDALIEKLKEYPVIWDAFKKKIHGYQLPPELVNDPDYGFHKLKRTSLLTCKVFLTSDIKYTEISAFHKSCYPMFYGIIGKQPLLVTHGGITNLPTILTPNADLVRGVGGYGDVEQVGNAFSKNCPGAIQVHGHRNLTDLEIQYNDNCFNVNGDVELGLRSVRIGGGVFETTQVGPKPETIKFYRENQLRRAKKFNAKKLTVQEEGESLIQMFQDHKHVNIKKLPNNIASMNFTRSAFENGIWDDITTKARGLFVALDSNTHKVPKGDIHIVARGYEKFFNLGERHGIELRDVRDLAFPLKMYEKANGYLGLLSVDDRDSKNPTWFTSSKSTTELEFAKHFRGMILESLTPELRERMQLDKTTVLFEVIDPVFDPHIQEYRGHELVIIGVIKNQLEFNQLSMDIQREYLALFNHDSGLAPIRNKILLAEVTTFNEFYIEYKKANDVEFISNDGHEGFVVEDSSPGGNNFKVKTDWYSFWKFMRSMKDRIANRIRKNTKRGQESLLTTSDMINLKRMLHHEEDIKVFQFMVDLAHKDFEKYTSMSIVDIRREMLIS